MLEVGNECASALNLIRTYATDGKALQADWSLSISPHFYSRAIWRIRWHLGQAVIFLIIPKCSLIKEGRRLEYQGISRFWCPSPVLSAISCFYSCLLHVPTAGSSILDVLGIRNKAAAKLVRNFYRSTQISLSGSALVHLNVKNSVIRNN